MKSKLYYTIIIAICAAILVISGLCIQKVYNSAKKKDYSVLYLIYDNNINIIEKNMDIVSSKNEQLPWVGFKNKNVNYYAELDMLVASISKCYIDFTGYNNIYTDAGDILNYRNVDDEDEYFNLKRTEGCGSAFSYNLEFPFESYTGLEKIIEEIDNYYEQNRDSIYTSNFEEYLSYKTALTSYVAKLTNYLILEYYHSELGEI